MGLLLPSPGLCVGGSLRVQAEVGLGQWKGRRSFTEVKPRLQLLSPTETRRFG